MCEGSFYHCEPSIDLDTDINNVGSIALALYAQMNPEYDHVEASKWQAAQVSTLSIGNCAGRVVIGSTLRSSFLIIPTFHRSDFGFHTCTVDIGNPLHGKLTPFIALSRSRRRNNIRLPHKIDERLFTKHRNKHLRQDIRLEWLDRETTAKWEAFRIKQGECKFEGEEVGRRNGYKSVAKRAGTQ